MDCMQFVAVFVFVAGAIVSIPQAVWIACNDGIWKSVFDEYGFNTASGMDCMQ